jgi:hypothetical protein
MPGGDVQVQLGMEGEVSLMPGRGDTIISGEAALSAKRAVTLLGVLGADA